MTDLRKAAEMALEALTLINQDLEKHRATLPIGRQPELCKASLVLRQALAQPEQEPVGACVTCGAPKSEWLVDAVNISQERVDETAKREHEPWPSLQCTCGATIYFKYTPPVSDYHEGWEEGFKAAKREWIGLTDEEMRRLKQKSVDDGMTRVVSDFEYIRSIEAKLKEKNHE